MNTIKRILSWVLSVMLLGHLFLSISTVNAIGTEIIATESTIVPMISSPDCDELYETYLERLFYPADSISFLGEAARDRLGSLGQNLYDYLKTNLLSVSSGASSSTVFSLNAEQISAWGGTVNYTKLESQTSQEAASTALHGFMEEFEVDHVIAALLHDCPYELYWYDKVTGVTENGKFTLSSDSCRISSVDFKFAVVTDMRAENYSSAAPVFDTTNAAAATAAADKAHALVEAFAHYTDSGKLVAYQQEICSLVSYNNEAASGGDFSTDADPWQLIYVFDGDSATNVVCEGYSKAFQYLFDLSEFEGIVDCITVSGAMSGEGHMWNIVTINKENYLADVTNSDANTVGADGGLFLAGASGSISDGYLVKGQTYTYSSSTLSLWGTDDNSKLKIAADNYQSCDLGHKIVTDARIDATCTETGLTEGAHCSRCGTVIVKQEVIPATGVHQYVDTVCSSCGAIGGSCGADLNWSLDEGVLTISGTGMMDDYAVKDPDAAEFTNPWGRYASRITEIVIADSVTSVGDYAFAGCTGVQMVIMPAGITTLGNTGVFSGCLCLKEIKFLGSAPALGLETFQGVTATVFYPSGDVSWMEVVTQNYGGSITWKPDCGGNHRAQTDAKIAPTCTETGLTEGSHCSACGQILKAQQIIPALGHAYQDKLVAPTCTTSGYTAHFCEVCGDQYTDQTVPALGHTWLDATCTTPKTCGVCNQQEGALLPHSYRDDWDTACDKCGHIRKLDITLTPMYRLYNPYTQEHLLTSNQAEKEQLISVGWHFDGVAWMTPSKGEPVYRLYNPFDDWHTYSMSLEEIDMLIPLGWKVDGVVCYSAAGNTDTPIFRLFNPYAQVNYHLLTASEEEIRWLVSLGWILEGVGWYGVR